MIGLSPSPQLLLALYEHLNVRVPARCLNPQISTALFRRDRGLYLVAVNNGSEDKIADVVLDGKVLGSPSWQVRNLVSGQEWSVNLHEHGHLTFPLPRKDGVILQLQGA